MSDCNSCALAAWNRTPSGRLSPTGDGVCRWDGWKKWQLASSFYYLNSKGNKPPEPNGGHISRHDPEVNCPMFRKIGTQK